jgi:hypothetical protein
MKKGITLTGLLFCFIFSFAQTPEKLLRDVREHVASTSQLRKALQKHVFYKYEFCWNDFPDTTFYLKQTILGGCFSYRTPAGEKDTVERIIKVRAICKGEQIGYVHMAERIYDQPGGSYQYKTILKHVDSSYTSGILNAYNTLHQTNFNWQDLYEDELDRFSIVPGLRVPAILTDSNGVEIGLADEPFLAGEMMAFVPLINKRDHGTIVKNCKSFNPTRKAYGALCLYVLQQMKEPLTTEEKQLLKNICQSDEITTFSQGCMVYRGKKISTILTKKELPNMANNVMRVVR